MTRPRVLVCLVVLGALLLVPAADASAGLRFVRPGGAVIPFAGEPTAVLVDVAAGQRIRFPTSIVDARPHGALFFVAQREPLIEASTNEEEASGWLAFSAASCQLGACVSFSVHALLGSELFEGRKARVDGSFAGTVG